MRSDIWRNAASRRGSTPSPSSTTSS